MIKGISRQVIVVHSPDRRLFEQAIFILHDDAAKGVTDEMLLQEAQRLMRGTQGEKKRRIWGYGAFWSVIGAAGTGLIWLLTALL